MPTQKQNSLSKFSFLALGFVCLILACLGFVLPGLPGTPFLLLSAACFAKSSPRLHAWLLANRFFGPIIKNWQESRSIPRRTKRIALLMVVIAGAFSIYSSEKSSTRLALLAILPIPMTILIRLPETEAQLAIKAAERSRPDR